MACCDDLVGQFLTFYGRASDDDDVMPRCGETGCKTRAYVPGSDNSDFHLIIPLFWG